MDWKGLPASDRTWEDLGWVAHLNPNANFEAKVRLASEGDVTNQIDQVTAKAILDAELGSEEDSTDQDGIPDEPDPSRTTRPEDLLVDLILFTNDV